MIAGSTVSSGPLRGELLGLDHLEERARVLAVHFTVTADPRKSPYRPHAALEDDARILRAAYQELVLAVRRGEDVPPAAEWLLDNFHEVEAAIRDVRRNLPRTFYRDLPKLAGPEHGGRARIHGLAIELIRHSDARFDLHRLTRFLLAFQAAAPLTLGELWAWPSMLKICLLANLAALSREILESRAGEAEADAYFARFETIGDEPLPPLPERPTTAFVLQVLRRMRELAPRVAELRVELDRRLGALGLDVEGAVRAEHQRQTMGQASVSNSITSLRLVSTLDWNEAVEKVSLIEQILQRDPSGVYPRMDFASRDRYRQAVEELADPTGDAQVRVALRVVENARAIQETIPADPRRTHVGWYLIGPGRRAFEADIGFVPRLGERLRRPLFRHATVFYLGSIGLLTAGMVAAACLYVWMNAPDLSATALALVGFLTMIPASQLALAIVQRVVHRLAPPRRLVRLEWSGGVPPEATTMIVVPVLVTSIRAARHQVQRLEVQALANPDPNLHFALLTDFKDAIEEELPEDEEILSVLIAGIEGLNERYAPGGREPFHLYHRSRRWNAREDVWMGWERKRGKLDEFNHLLRGAEDTSFHVRVGDASVLPRVVYVITLDADTRLPRDAARSLIGISEHPLNRPLYDARLRRVVQGYGILQPRVSITMASAAGSAFARVYAGHTGVDPYSRAVSDTYQDLFGEGIFTGKGLYHVDTFLAALEGRVPENALLSHDLFEGLFARCALVSDIEVVDDFPSSVLAHAARQQRWVRGDWQILGWLFPWVPGRRGLLRNALPLVSRWKILDNLRRSLLAPSLVALLASAWTWLPGLPAAWVGFTTLIIANPLLVELPRALRGPRPQQPLSVFLRDLGEQLETAAAQAILDAMLLAYNAWQMLQAIGVTLVRLVVTQRRLLEWETAAAAAARMAGMSELRPYAASMWVGPMLGFTLAFVALAVRPAALPSAFPFLALWIASPFLSFWLSLPVAPRILLATPEEKAYLRRVARRTWRYFEEHVGAADHWLAPDNLQEVPDPRVAHRTSPTNLGMGLLATLATHDLGFLSTEELESRIDRMLTAIESLEKFEGHLFNWYDTQSLGPLLPRYVSTVDSGNLAGSLWALAQGLRQAARTPPDGAVRAAALGDTASLLRDAVGAWVRSGHGRTRLRARAIAGDVRGLRGLERAEDDPEKNRIRRDAARVGVGRLLFALEEEAAQAVAAAGVSAMAAAQAPDLGVAAAREAVYWGRALLALLDRHDRAVSEAPEDRTQALFGLAGRADRIADAMNFRFLYDRSRRMFSIGYRDADADGPGRLDPAYYDLLASEARLASFVAIAKGDVPQDHWFQLGRSLTSIHGRPTLVSWSGSMFEYLMPALLLRTYPETLLSDTHRGALRAQVDHGHRHEVPWGVSESAFNLVDRIGNYQYKAFGIPELGLKRGLVEDLVIAPYATALAAMVDPGRAVANLQRLARLGALGRYGFYEAVDYTPREGFKPGDEDTPRALGRGVVVRAYFAHHQGMALVAFANAALDTGMAARFHAVPRVQATELLLQERTPFYVPVTRPRPLEVTHVAPPILAIAPRRYRSPHTPQPHAAFLSNGRYTAMVTNAGGGFSQCRGRMVTRRRDDGTVDPGSQFLYLRDVRSGEVWSAAHHPTAIESDDYRATLYADRVAIARTTYEIESLLEIAVSPEDDVEMRRLSLTNRSQRTREIEITSYVEVALAAPLEDLAHPAFGKLFLETEARPDTASLLCGRRPRAPEQPGEWAVHVLSSDRFGLSALEWETDRARFIGRGRTVANPVALDGRALSGTTGATLDPILSLRQRIRLAPGGFARIAFATGAVPDREAAIALSMKYSDAD